MIILQLIEPAKYFFYVQKFNKTTETRVRNYMEENPEMAAPRRVVVPASAEHRPVPQEFSFSKSHPPALLFCVGVKVKGLS